MFRERSDLRFWAKSNGARQHNWSAKDSALPDFWLNHTDTFGNENIVWAHLMLGRAYVYKTSLNIRPQQRHAIVDLRSRGNKLGIIVGIKDTPMVYAVRIRPDIFSGEFSLDKYTEKNLAIALDHTDARALSIAIEFFARDDFVWRSQLPSTKEN